MIIELALASEMFLKFYTSGSEVYAEVKGFLRVLATFQATEKMQLLYHEIWAENFVFLINHFEKLEAKLFSF